ncbi:FHA domain-containing protein [Kribbella sp. NPDC051620]|uniref:FHA domain-containing protein n=1 Tax=Kribbella sp. NPDC051620 TaxID=3364120 RepID=UPI0037BCE945
MGNESFLSLGEQRWVLPAGRPSLTIGRDPAADIHLDANDLASRLHARLWLSSAGWSISDDGSRNGTRVNGRPVTVAVPLHDNDRIQIGDAVLTFHGPEAAAPPAEAPPARPTGSSGGGGSRVRLVKVMTVAAVVQGVGLAANGIAAFVADHVGGIARWLAAPAVALIAAMVTALIQAVSKEPAASSTSTTAVPTRRRGTPAAVAILVVLAVVGLGGFAVAAGVQYAAGYLTGKESGDDRLVRPVAKSGSGLTATVVHVAYTSHFTRVELTVRNSTQTSLSLPLFGFCTFTGSDGTTLQVDAFRSQWTDTVPPGAFQRGTITFRGHLPDNLTTASLSFSQVFGPGGSSLTIPGIKLKPA